MHYEIEVRKDRAWQPLSKDGKAIKFTTLESAGRRALELSENGSKVRIRQTLIKTINMKDLLWLMKQTEK